MLYTPPTIAHILGAPLANVQTYWPLINDQLIAYKMADRYPTIAALATIGVECPPFKPIHEYGHIEQDEHLKGWNQAYAGRGFIQLTWEYNYEKYGKEIGVDLVKNPDEALEGVNASKIFCAFFRDHRVDVWARKAGAATSDVARLDAWQKVRRQVNGGLNGWTKFISLVQRLDAIR